MNAESSDSSLWTIQPRRRDRALRLPYRDHAILRAGPSRIVARGVNLSITGMLLEVPPDAPSVAQLRLQFQLSTDQAWLDLHAVRARVVMLPRSRLWGVRFVQLTTQQVRTLGRFVNAGPGQRLPAGAPRPAPAPAAVTARSPSREDDPDWLDAEIRRLCDEAARAVEAPTLDLKPLRSRRPV